MYYSLPLFLLVANAAAAALDVEVVQGFDVATISKVKANMVTISTHR